MKPLILSILMLASVKAAEIVADFASVINKPPATAKATFGKPESTHTASANWAKDGWSWHMTFENGKTVIGNVEEIPKDKCPANLTDAAALFGFTREKGWHVGQQFKRGYCQCVFLTHMDKGIFTLKASLGDAPAAFSALICLAPGKE